MSIEIQQAFNAISEKYDKQRPLLIPCFKDFYGVTLELSNNISNVENILDIGAGTGLLSAFYAEKYPNANITLVDISADMLNKAKNRFQGNDKINFLQADFSTVDFEEGKYDLVVSGLAIHHLTHELKQVLFQKIYYALKSSGMFINADQVKGATDFSEKIYTENWRNHVLASSLTEEEKQSAFERIKLDIMAPLDEQLKWLRDAGFSMANCFYQYFNFVVFAAKKDSIINQTSLN
ncbi:class I SAM-dependent methyltransferase [Arachidicoccus soli]|uniref:Class I SAM-dependent methyltransferase n=1 Tax=Arachidicoccus soli TaxID=2341117 RepID=A0A386HLT4_9BACT|nr:class I SAM-dependent methyltransferase [Arachidicoccus soli]AYD46857.1 class I SAM-dependent methyltransferase [Arachidicoccus soli]